jgi:hypothetical protein
MGVILAAGFVVLPLLEMHPVSGIKEGVTSCTHKNIIHTESIQYLWTHLHTA